MSFTVDVNTLTVNVGTPDGGGAGIQHWTDGGFPSDVQPCPLFHNAVPIVLPVTVPAAGTYTVTCDTPTNYNINTAILTGSPDYSYAGATTINGNSSGPGGRYGQNVGLVDFPASGPANLNLTGSAGYVFFGIKTLYFTDYVPPPPPTPVTYSNQGNAIHLSYVSIIPKPLITTFQLELIDTGQAFRHYQLRR